MPLIPVIFSLSFFWTMLLCCLSGCSEPWYKSLLKYPVLFLPRKEHLAFCLSRSLGCSGPNHLPSVWFSSSSSVEHRASISRGLWVAVVQIICHSFGSSSPPPLGTILPSIWFSSSSFVDLFSSPSEDLLFCSRESVWSAGVCYWPVFLKASMVSASETRKTLSNPLHLYNILEDK
ncbi:uncharacterized protein [Coffea arabica]|uniref:Uncharacterized protein isoform X2 n=1 Tax=Coffea arabica TaxID=13443 RepID=A0ABM4WHT6_COFAR